MRFVKLRYSLRTFLVLFTLVALFAGWFAYHWNIKRERQELLAWISAQGGEYQTYETVASVNAFMVRGGSQVPEASDSKEAQISAIRTWLGDAPISYIIMTEAKLITWAEGDRIIRLFPEARVIMQRYDLTKEIKMQHQALPIYHELLEMKRRRLAKKNAAS